jgi:outer membrane protein
MNKNILHNKIHLLIIIISTLTTVFVGCEKTHIDDDFYEINIPTEKTRQIEIFQPEELSPTEQKGQIESFRPEDLLPGEPATPEPDITPPKELALTLEESRVLAMENNLDLKAELFDPAIAAEQLNAQEAKFEAAFSTNINYARTDSPPAADLAISGSQEDSGTGVLGVEIPLQTGGTVIFNMIDNRTKSNFESSTFDPLYLSDASLSISQPLLRNAGKRINMHSIRLARYQQEVENARTKLEVITTIAAADRVYWRLYAARRELEVRKQQYDLAQAQLERAQRFVEAGERAQVEVIRAEAGLARQLADIIVAENSVRDRQRELKRTLNKPGLNMETPTVLITTTEPDPVHYVFETDRLIQQAVENRMDLLELELQIAQDISTIDYLKNQALPLVTLDYTYNVNGLGPTRNDAYDLLYHKNFEDHRLGLQLVVPLGNAAAKANLREAFLRRRQRLTSRQSRRQLIELEVLNAVDQLEANWQQILASRQSAILDGRLYEAEMRQFELGLRTSTDVLEAQTNFANSQSAEISALTQYQIALVDLAYATGTLLGAAKVQWEPIKP